MADKKKVAKKKAVAKKKVSAQPSLPTSSYEEVVALLRAIDGKLELISDYVLENRAPVEDRIEVKENKLTVETSKKGESGSAVLINQNGDKIDGTVGLSTPTIERIEFKTVQAEAQLLCNIEKETTKAGFHKAKAIISSFGVGKIAELAPKFYADIINQFRTEVKNWK